MKFTPDFIQRVQEANNLVDLIAQHTTLKPSGGGLMGRCPFPDHPEKTPSFSVSESKQVYNCFGCHKKGNIFSFLEQFNGMSFPEAVEYLAARANISLPTSAPEESERLDKLSQKKRQLLHINKLAMQFFYDQLQTAPTHHHAKKYAQSRGLDSSIIETFKIGYAPAEWDSLLKFLTQKGIPAELLEEAKLIKARANGPSGFFDLFRDRLMFPIFDTKNEVIAFGGRALTKDDVKYLNSPETLVFSKSKTLYGLSETAKFVRAEDQAILVEGYMDLISLYKSGIKNVVAPMGTALTPDQCRILKRHTTNIVVLFDGDTAGRGAAERGLPMLLQAGTLPRGLTLPEELDPDEFINAKGVAELEALLKNAPDLFSLVLDSHLVGYNGESSEKLRLIDYFKPIFANIADSRLQDLYLMEIGRKLSLDAKWLSSSLGIPPKGGPIGKSPALKPNPQTAPQFNSEPNAEASIGDKIQLKGATPAETTLMAVAIKNRANFEELLRTETLPQVIHAGVRKVLDQAALVYRQEPNKFDTLASLLANFVDDPDRLFFVDPRAQKSLAENRSEEGATHSIDSMNQEDEKRLLQDCAKRVRDRYLRYQTHLIGQELKGSQLPNQQLNPERLEQIMNLQRDRLGLKKKNDVT